MKHQYSQNKGFSLIELMVSLTIFSIIMTVSIGTLLVMIDANAKAQALYSAMTNLSFAVDSMGRSIRTGYDYYCDSANRLETDLSPGERRDCLNGETGIAFTREKDGCRVAYRLVNSVIQQRIDDTSPTCTEETEWLPITARSANVQTFEVVVDGSEAGDEVQPTVGILIEGEVDNGLDETTDFSLQTRVTEKILNY